MSKRNPRDIRKALHELIMTVKAADRKMRMSEDVVTDEEGNEKEVAMKKVYKRRGHAISFDEDGVPNYDRRLKNFKNIFPKKIEESLRAVSLVETLIEYDLSDRRAKIVTEILSLSHDIEKLNELASDSAFLGTEAMMQHIFACINNEGE